MINETVHKGGDENSSHFVHFKVIHMLPEDEDETTAASPVDETRDIEEPTEQPEQEKEQPIPEIVEQEKSHGVDSGLTSENEKKDTKVDGINPADFGYQVGDNEIDKTDTVVVNLPAASDAELPTGPDSVPKV